MDTLPLMPGGLTVSEEWLALEQSSLGDTVLLVGTTDTGKSTLARWLLEKACCSGRTSAWLDADLGQSSLGIPGTLNLVIVEGTSSAVVDRAAFFVGSTSPRGHMLQILTGLRRLRDRARVRGADPIFIDTTGLVAEESGGGALKEWEVELLQPTAIVALQRARELEHLLAPWRHDPRLRLHLLPVAAGVQQRSPGERAGRRRVLFSRYFDEAGSLRIYKGRNPVYGLRDAEPGCLTGLIDRDGFLLKAAVVRQVLPDGLQLISPWSSPEQVAVVRVGKLRIDPQTGMELRDP
jgi:polynucleotide 5'-hydroxyl-kinase GRC3/NOL9